MRAIQPGEVLVEQGDSTVPFFVVVSGELEVVRSSGADETLITVHAPGQFTGEVSTLSGRRALFRLRAAKSGEVIELERQRMLALVQTDAELGEIVMRAFILRRVELVAALRARCVWPRSAHFRTWALLPSCKRKKDGPYLRRDDSFWAGYLAAAAGRKMCRKNPGWGAPHIHGELLKLGIDIGGAA
jgi:CRP-like cAMP-binding protein